MKVFQDMNFHGRPSALLHFVELMDASAGWQRNKELEEQLDHPERYRMWCYSRPGNKGRLAADVWLGRTDEECLEVSNILSNDKDSLTTTQYNKILKQFHDEVAAPAALTSGVLIEAGNAEPDLEEYFSKHTAWLLRSFAKTATGAVPDFPDQKRWHMFLCSAYREGASMEADMLEDWLLEQGWKPAKAEKYMLDYESSLLLLEMFITQADRP